ncbi:MAG: DNA polymerase I [Alphaproteobacteria bacterium]
MSSSEPALAVVPQPIRRLHLVDGSGYIFRAYHALPPMNRPDGTPTNAVYGFTNMILKLVKDTDTDAVAVIFDAARRNFRNDLYADYKAHRPEAPEDLVPQFSLIRDATRAFNLPCIEVDGFEADDIIATYARLAVSEGIEVCIVSSDKDLMQLVGDGISMLDPIKNRPIGREEVMEKFGVPPEKVVDVQSLAGDSTDNVPGVPGIGVKTAAQLIVEYGDLDSLLARAGEIKQPKRRESLLEFADMARISRDLVRLRDDVPVPMALDALRLVEPEPETMLAFLREQDFKRTIARLESLQTASGARPPAAPAEAAPPGGAAYELVQTAEALDRWVAAASAAGLCALDIQATSQEGMRAESIGLSLAVAPGRACYIPVGHKASLELDQPPQQLPLAATLDRLRPLLADPGVLKVGHDIKFDMTVLANLGLAVAPADDTMLLSYVIEAGAHGHGLADLAELHLSHTMLKPEDLTGSGRNRVGFDQVPLDRALACAAESADVTLRLHAVLKKQLLLDRLVTVYETIERPLLQVLLDMERAGVMVDRVELARLSQRFAGRMAELEAEIHRLAGRPFNIGSPKQLGEVLFDEMGIDGGRKGKTGAYSTGADVLEALAAQGYDLPARVLDWRQVSKLKSTYTDTLPDQINPGTGRVHTSYAMAVAQTGRLSSNDPNLQNIPIRTEEGRQIRRAFVAAPGHKLVSLDYSQIELRLLAHVADIGTLKQAFRDGVDIHALTASQVFGVPLAQMDADTRRKAKAINFGIIYGISAFGLARNLGIPQGEAKAYIEAYFERYPGIRAYMDGMRAICREQGYVTTIFGRRIHIPSIREKNPAARNFAERQAINAPLQGAAADIIKRAMRRVPQALADAGLGGRMLLQVHDELLFEVPEGEVEATITTVKMAMEGATRPAVELTVPLVVEAGVGANWAEAH